MRGDALNLESEQYEFKSTKISPKCTLFLIRIDFIRISRRKFANFKNILRKKPKAEILKGV